MNICKNRFAHTQIYQKKIPFQPVKQRRVDNSEEKPENVNPNEVNLPKTMEADKNKGFSCIGE
jgi:hypothetical protein